MARLTFTRDGQSHVADVFSGGKTVQLAFPEEGTQVLYVDSRLGSTLPWKTVDSRVVELDLVINIPDTGQGQEFRLRCFMEPLSAEIVQMPSPGGGGSGSQPGPDTVGSSEIRDDSIEMEDLSPDVRGNMADRVSREELDGFKV